MSQQKIIEAIRKKAYKPVYFLHGEESYHIDAITKVFEEEILSESEKSFNFTVLYGKDSDYRQVRDAARRFPMMAERQVVIIKEAKEMRTLAQLKDYVEKPTPSTILLICHKHKKYDMRSALGKALKKHAEVFESKKLYDNQVPDWIRDHIRGRGLDINTPALDMMTEYLGTDLSKIANEVEKLTLNLPAATTITPQHVQDNIGISKDYNVFELQEALGSRDHAKAHRIVSHFAANPRKYPLVVTLASLYGFFSKLYIAAAFAQSSDVDMAKALGFTFRDPSKARYAAKFRVAKFRKAVKHYSRPQVERVFSLLREYDLKSKGVGNVGMPEGELLRELMLRVLAV